MALSSKRIQAIALKPSPWTPTFSFTRQNYNLRIQKDKEATTLTKHYFQHFLISSPQISHTTQSVSLKIYLYMNRDLKPAAKESGIYNLDKFTGFLKSVYGDRKKVGLEVIPISAPYLNPEIAAQYLALSSKKFAFSTLTNKFMKATPLSDVVEGVKVQVSGRLGRRKGAGRSSRIVRQKGKLGFASFRSKVQAARCEFKNRNGKIGVVVWIRSGTRSLVPGAGKEGKMREFINRWKDRKAAELASKPFSPSSSHSSSNSSKEI